MLHVLSDEAFVVAVTLPGPGGVRLFALRRAGSRTPAVTAEAYDADGMVAAGDLTILDLTQALTSLRAGGSQARRLALRADRPGHGGHLDLVTGGLEATLVVAGADGGRAEWRAPAAGLAEDLGAVLRAYLALNRAAGRQIVLPDAQPSARAALIRPVP